MMDDTRQRSALLNEYLNHIRVNTKEDVDYTVWLERLVIALRKPDSGSKK